MGIQTQAAPSPALTRRFARDLGVSVVLEVFRMRRCRTACRALSVSLDWPLPDAFAKVVSVSFIEAEFFTFFLHKEKCLQ